MAKQQVFRLFHGKHATCRSLSSSWHSACYMDTSVILFLELKSHSDGCHHQWDTDRKTLPWKVFLKKKKWVKRNMKYVWLNGSHNATVSVLILNALSPVCAQFKNQIKCSLKDLYLCSHLSTFLYNYGVITAQLQIVLTKCDTAACCYQTNYSLDLDWIC